MSARFDFTGKKVIVTGASRGIGAEVARGFIASGAKVAAAGRDTERLAAIAGPADRVRAFPFDLGELELLPSVLGEIVSWLGGCDVFVNAAAYPLLKDPLTLDAADWDLTLRVNLIGPYLCIKELIGPLKQSGNGRIILFGSVAGKTGGLGANMAYSASKGGVFAMTFNLARELAKSGVTVNCLTPGPTETKMMLSFPDEVLERTIAAHPLGRLGRPEEIAPAALFLASEEAAHITGHAFDVNGGFYTR
ncbi:MAG: SDR family oxidoreductase [bacterium]|nr:SDR family oxidoreductase [bacterium]